jgi:hypothetical protein
MLLWFLGYRFDSHPNLRGAKTQRGCGRGIPCVSQGSAGGCMTDAQDMDLLGCIIDRVKNDVRIAHDGHFANAGDLTLPGAAWKIGKQIQRL